MAESRFPTNGAFHEQQEYVNSLSEYKKNDRFTQAIKIVEKSESPFGLSCSQMPKEVDVRVFHHSVTNKSTTAVVTRTLLLNAKKERQEAMTLHVPNGNDKSTSFAVKFNPDGTVDSVEQRVQSMAALTKELESHNKTNEGIVVEVADDKEYKANEKPQEPVYYSFKKG